MGFFSKLKNKVFGGNAKDTAAKKAPEATPPAPTPEAAQVEPITQPTAETVAISVTESAADTSAQPVDVAAQLDAMNAAHAEDLSWRTSIVDLLKLVDMDSSYASRKELAADIGIEGYEGSAEDNIALNKAVLVKLSENGATVPAELLA